MSQESLKEFVEHVQGDSSLQDKLKAAGNDGSVVEIAKAAGFSITTDDLDTAKAELSEEELEAASGGATPAVPWTAYVLATTFIK